MRTHRRTTGGRAGLALVIAMSMLAFSTTPALAAAVRTNQCTDFLGTDLNALYATNDAFVVPDYCGTAFAGSYWRPVMAWFAASTFFVIPPDYEPVGDTPMEDFRAKLESARYVVDAGTGNERSIAVDASDLTVDTVTLDEFTEMARITARLPGLPLGDHTVDMYLTMSGEHWDGFGVEEFNRLPAGESFVWSGAMHVVKPQTEPKGPPPGTTPALRLELTWDTEADLDLHLLNPDGDWNTAPWDCYWANSHPNWGRLGSRDDDPALLVDDTDGFGPEIISLGELERVTYKVGVLYFDGDSATTATVRVFADDQLVAELSVEIPSRLHFWTVAAISVQGRSLKVTPINTIESVID